MNLLYYAFSLIALVGMSNGRMRNVQPAPASITPPAMVMKRQDPQDITNNPSFVGFYSTSSNYSAIYCASTETWTTSNSLGNCCATTGGCTLYFGCASFNQLLYSPRNTATCATDYGCNTATVFYGSTPISQVVCFNEYWKAATMFRDISLTSSSSSSTPASSNLASTPTFTPSPSTSVSKSSSKAWIAGAVIGPVAAFAIIAVLSFWIWKLKRRQNPTGEVKYAAHEPYTPNVPSAAPTPYPAHQPERMSELAG
ncbi:hypothetical protein K432DRAFT_398394 [Lepidopterella palustris CBS 459.81]|uniref:Mid2 domain-containing protein n=1 Tax=Lepidopterella palustris CBS 459.81 TaxID=1314670 RepID=A0A8E2DYF4_9PEZI|nr:hypothetical protein K432DRAFT_398394 [Lepidopterella palustris CBS 459.81]